jgi:hypothetical protein
VNLNIGLLAELADALDSKSVTTPQKRSEKQHETQSPVLRFTSALAKVGSEWPGLGSEIRAAIVRIVEDGAGEK